MKKDTNKKITISSDTEVTINRFLNMIIGIALGLVLLASGSILLGMVGVLGFGYGSVVGFNLFMEALHNLLKAEPEFVAIAGVAR